MRHFHYLINMRRAILTKGITEGSGVSIGRVEFEFYWRGNKIILDAYYVKTAKLFEMD